MPKNHRATVDIQFDPRRNALNLLRLCFALLVIVSHSIILGGYRSEILWGRTTLGDIAVNGFFALSGFVIAASAVRNGTVRYLWHRALRIFPAFWVCLAFTAVVAGPVGWIAAGNPLGKYWTADLGPMHYVVVNWFLKMRTFEIAGTPTAVPFPHAWDGSLWTLLYEFYCYLLISVLAVTTILRRRRVVLVIWLASWSIAVATTITGVSVPFGAAMVRFVPIFFAGSVLWLYRDKIPDSKQLLVASLLLFFVGTFLPNSDVISGPPLAYVCVWASIHLPGKRVGTKYDISYGTYIYAFVAAQMLAVYHVQEWGYLPFTLLTVAVTWVLATISCVIVEQPALRLKNWSPPRLAWTGPTRSNDGQRPNTPPVSSTRELAQRAKKDGMENPDE